MNLQQLYDHSPVWTQNLMCSLKGWQIQRRRYGSAFHRAMVAYESRTIDPAKRLLRLFETVRFVPYYKPIVEKKEFVELYNDLINNEIVLLGGVKKLLSMFPVIDKNEVKSHWTDFVNTTYTGKTIIMHTSGTTGGGLVFPYSVEMENEQWAVWWRYRRALGIGFDTWCGWFGGRVIISPQNRRSPYWRINRPGRQVMFSLYHLTPETVADYYAEICQRDLKWLHGYPSSLSRFATLIMEAGLPPLKGVRVLTTGAENLYDYQVEQMRHAFPDAVVRQHYGLAEGVANMSQDLDGEWHLDDDFCRVEFIPVDAFDSTTCRIIGTNLTNLAFPLLRYDTGDIACVEWKDGSPRLLRIEGRSNDYITLPGGAKINSGLDYILKDCTSVREAQLHQHTLTDFEMRIVRNPGYDAAVDEPYIRNGFHERVGTNVGLTFTYVDEIPKTKAGKFKMFVSDLQ